MIALEEPSRAKGAKPARSARGLSRTAVNFLLDLFLLLVFLVLAWTAVVLRFVFPAGTAAAGWRLWGAGYDDWTAWQFAWTCVFALAVLVHVMLHWSWVCGVVSSRLSRWRGATVRADEGTQTLYGVGLLIVVVNVLGLLIVAAALGIRPPARSSVDGCFRPTTTDFRRLGVLDLGLSSLPSPGNLSRRPWTLPPRCCSDADSWRCVVVDAS